VIQRRVGLDLVLEQLVDEAVVEVEAGRVRRTASLRDHSRPGDREAKGVEPEPSDQLDVLPVAVVRVARHRTVVAVAHVAGYRTEAVPDALTATVLVRGPFDLIRGRGRAPGEGGRKVVAVGVHVNSFPD
jgi:hypothetical protein